MIYRYNLASLQERFELSVNDIERFIEQGILLPEKWELSNHLQQQKLIKENFAFCTWIIDEVERFNTIINLAKDKHLTFYHMLNSRLNEITSNFNHNFNIILSKIESLNYNFNELRAQLDRREIMIDNKYFSEITGYKPQTFRNNVQIIDDKGQMMRLNIDYYKDLIWHKIKGKWQTPLQQFEQLRSGFNYAVYLDERKRKGEFIPRMKEHEI